jgi:hypothetical protein
MNPAQVSIIFFAFGSSIAYLLRSPRTRTPTNVSLRHQTKSTHRWPRQTQNAATLILRVKPPSHSILLPFNNDERDIEYIPANKVPELEDSGYLSSNSKSIRIHHQIHIRIPAKPSFSIASTLPIRRRGRHYSRTYTYPYLCLLAQSPTSTTKVGSRVRH